MSGDLGNVEEGLRGGGLVQGPVDNLMCHPEVSVRDALVILDKTGTGIVLVVDDNDRLIGTVTDGDVRRATLDRLSLDGPVSSLFAYRLPGYLEPTSVRANTSNEERLRVMRARSLRHLPVLDGDGRVVDITLLSELLDEPPAPVSAIVFAGGYGTRLQPLTNGMPKPMLPVGGRPLLERTIAQLAASGIQDVRVTTYYMPEKIKEHFGDGRNFGVRIRYVDEQRPLGTAGALGLIEQPDVPTLVINGDILTDLNFRAFFDFHREQQADMTLAVRKYEFQVEYGVVESEGIETTGLIEKPCFEFFINAGIYLLEPGVFTYVREGERLDMTDVIGSLIADSRRVISFPIREYWLDIGHRSDYAQANDDIHEGKVNLELG